MYVYVLYNVCGRCKQFLISRLLMIQSRQKIAVLLSVISKTFPSNFSGNGLINIRAVQINYLILFISYLVCAIIYFYYINNSEIPGEVSREKMISSHVKITWYLHMWRNHRSYSYKINRAFCSKNWKVWYSLVFI